MANEQSRVDEAENERLGRTLSGQYDKKDSVEARAYNRREKKDVDEEKRLAEEKVYAETLARDAIENAQESSAQRLATLRAQAKQKPRSLRESSVKRKGGKISAGYSLLSIVVAAYIWQLLFGLVSLFLITGHFTLAESFFGKILTNIIPLESMGYAFWGLSTIIAVCTYVGFLFYFYITGAGTMDTPVTSLITALAFAFSILPVLNLAPSIVIWVIYVNYRSTLEWLKALKPSSSHVMGGV